MSSAVPSDDVITSYDSGSAVVSNSLALSSQLLPQYRRDGQSYWQLTLEKPYLVYHMMFFIEEQNTTGMSILETSTDGREDNCNFNESKERITLNITRGEERLQELSHFCFLSFLMRILQNLYEVFRLI